MSVDPRVSALCAEVGLEVLPAHMAPVEGQTRAVATIRRLIDKHGEGHARLVLLIFAEGKGNAALADEASINAVSDLLLACPELVEFATSELLEMFDQIPIGAYMMVANELRGFVPQRPAIAGMLYMHIRKLKDIAAQRASDARTRKARSSEQQKGREWHERGPHLSPAQKLQIGRQLLQAKATLPWGHFGPWLAGQGVSARMAYQCMRLAREVDAEPERQAA